MQVKCPYFLEFLLQEPGEGLAGEGGEEALGGGAGVADEVGEAYAAVGVAEEG